jgi:hypothetical protein
MSDGLTKIGGNEVRKLQTMLLAALALGLTTVGPAFAGDNDTATMAKNVCWFPVQVAGVATAAVIGTPICAVRRCAVRIHDFTSEGADKIGGHDHFPPVFLASFFGVPCGTLVGMSEGVYYGSKNALSHGVEHPFGLDSFSMGSDVEK